MREWRPPKIKYSRVEREREKKGERERQREGERGRENVRSFLFISTMKRCRKNKTCLLHAGRLPKETPLSVPLTKDFTVFDSNYRH